MKHFNFQLCLYLSREETQIFLGLHQEGHLAIWQFKHAVLIAVVTTYETSSVLICYIK